MNAKTQDAVCTFVREIMSARTGEAVEIADHPELIDRNNPAVEQRWESPSHRYAVEHTRLESYDGQIENEINVQRFITPVREFLVGRLPGAHFLTVLVRELQAARIKYADAHAEILRLTLEAASQLKDGETVILPSSRLPFRVQLHRRHGKGSHVAVYCVAERSSDSIRMTFARLQS